MSSSAVSRALLDWYDTRARTLPWRAPPGEPQTDPYRVWLSEIMLQQTTVAAVKPYFAKFTKIWPDVKALAGASEADVMAAWAGLGYYARARNLHACAKIVAKKHGGRFPETEAGLHDLPGIGTYTAAAIAAIAFDEPAVVIDANVERVVTRLQAIETPLPGARKQIREIASQITPRDRAGDFAQAMMDLGATICTTRSPGCAICPLLARCAAAKTVDPAAFPVKPPKKTKPLRKGTAFWLEHDAHVLLVRRPPEGMLGGMRALPTGPWEDTPPGLAGEPAKADWLERGVISHVFTHFALDLDVVAATALTHESTGGEWWPIETIEEAGLPTLFAKAATLARAQREESK